MVLIEVPGVDVTTDGRPVVLVVGDGGIVASAVVELMGVVVVTAGC